MKGSYSSADCHFIVSGNDKKELYIPSFDSPEVIHTPVRTRQAGTGEEKILKTVHGTQDTAFIQKYGSVISRRRRRSAASHLKNRLFQILLAAVFLTMIFGGIAVHADPGFGRQENHMVYRQVIVEPGDTLWDIAVEWHDSTGDSIRTYIRKLQKMNHLHGDLIREGKPLLIYYGSTAEERK